MSQIIITKGKLLKGDKKGSDKVEIDYKQKDSEDSKPEKCSYEHDAPPTKQFRNAFAALSIHSALLGEFITITSVKDIKKPEPDVANAFTVTGFTIIADGTEDEGVMLTAHKNLSNNKALGFNTPTARFKDVSENAYPYLEELEACINICKDELREYLNGVHEVDPQGNLFDTPKS